MTTELLLTMWNKENTRQFGYYDEFWKIPTHKIAALPTYNQFLEIYDFVVYASPKPRDYGQINSHSQRTAEPIKLALVGNDYEWRTAVANWLESDLFIEQPFGLQHLIRRPRTIGNRNFRLHYARFILPYPYPEWSNSEPFYSKRYSPSFTAYYIGTGADRLFINEAYVDAAYRADPSSWNAEGRRAYTIPEDWLSNRINENKDKYALFS